MKIILSGYRAAGKSTLGRLLSARHGWSLFDVDRGIEEKTGKTLTALYEELGEAGYRPIETEVIAAMCAGVGESRVVSLSAGSLIQRENWSYVKGEDSLVVYLKASPQELWRRISEDPASASTRPRLTKGGLDEVVEVLAIRAPAYEQCADLVVDATLAPELLADEVDAYLAGMQ